MNPTPHLLKFYLFLMLPNNVFFIHIQHINAVITSTVYAIYVYTYYVMQHILYVTYSE